MLRSSVQMVMLTAPDVRTAARFYVDLLGFRDVSSGETEAIVEGFGMQVVPSPGPGGPHARAPSPEQAAFEVPASMARIESVWEHDCARDPGVLGPILDPRGSFVYVTLDPARNAVALVSPLPADGEALPQGRVTQKLRRPDLG